MSKTISPVHSKKTNRLVNRTETVRRIEKILTYMKSFTKLRHSELNIQIIPHFRMVVQPSEYRCENLRSTADLLRAGVNPSHHSCSQRIFFPETDQYIRPPIQTFPILIMPTFHYREQRCLRRFIPRKHISFLWKMKDIIMAFGEILYRLALGVCKVVQGLKILQRTLQPLDKLEIILRSALRRNTDLQLLQVLHFLQRCFDRQTRHNPLRKWIGNKRVFSVLITLKIIKANLLINLHNFGTNSNTEQKIKIKQILLLHTQYTIFHVNIARSLINQPAFPCKNLIFLLPPQKFTSSCQQSVVRTAVPPWIH